MSKFEGYLLKFAETNQILPNKYIQLDSYDSTPNHREEIKAYRSDNSRSLHRITAKGHKSDIVFSTRDKLHLEDKIAFQTLFNNAIKKAEETYPDAVKERKFKCTYWNDEDNEYKTGWFYYPDVKFHIYKIDEDTRDIVYASLEISLVEY